MSGMVVDASAIVAIMENEPDAENFKAAFLQSSRSLISQFNYVEAGIVLVARGRVADSKGFREVIEDDLGITVSSVDLAEEALAAYLRFGKGIHRAKLNIGDCFAYALSKRTGLPLLFKGDDFPHTDVEPVLQPT